MAKIEIKKIFKLEQDFNFNIPLFDSSQIKLDKELTKIWKKYIPDKSLKHTVFKERVKLSHVWELYNISFIEKDGSKRLRKNPDFISGGRCTGFSEKGLNSLKDLIPNDIEILPVNNTYSKTKYFLINIPYDLDCLGEKTVKERIHFKRYDFDLDKIENNHIFRVKDDLTNIYVTDIFVKKVLENKLKGFRFDPVWIKGDKKIYEYPFMITYSIYSSDESTWSHFNV
ncbi:MAG: hypothetical protein U0457_00280 [Candidatus Sericytochromatia bacterium]